MAHFFLHPRTFPLLNSNVYFFCIFCKLGALKFLAVMYYVLMGTDFGDARDRHLIMRLSPGKSRYECRCTYIFGNLMHTII